MVKIVRSLPQLMPQTAYVLAKTTAIKVPPNTNYKFVCNYNDPDKSYRKTDIANLYAIITYWIAKLVIWELFQIRLADIQFEWKDLGTC